MSSVYKYLRLSQTNNSSLPTLQNSVTQTSFQIPANVPFNPSRSFIQFDLLTNVATRSISLFTDCVPFDSISLDDGGSQRLVDLHDIQSYSKTVRAAYNSLTDYNSKGPAYVSNTLVGGLDTLSNQLQPCRAGAVPVVLPAVGNFSVTATQFTAAPYAAADHRCPLPLPRTPPPGRRRRPAGRPPGRSP